MKKLSLILVILVAFGAKAFAQETIAPSLKTYKVAIFAPLYLDSAFNGKFYKYGKKMPRFVMSGLEFVQGAQIALDSLPVINGNINATIFDSKAYNPNLSTVLASSLLDSFNLFIGSVRDADFLQLANFAKAKKIPFISATYPNDGGVSDNPYLVIANPTLRAHCEAIFSYILQTGGSSNIILARKTGAQEDKVEQYFRSSNSPDGIQLLKIKVVDVGTDVTQINYHLDSTKNNIVIGGSLSEAFATELAKQCSTINKLYPITLIGMPNWDGFRIANGGSKDIKDFPVHYTSAYFNNKYDANSRKIQSIYKRKFKSWPTDLVYKGYDAAFVFTRLLTRYPFDYMNHINDYTLKVYSEYNFKPISTSGTTDYYENKRLYLVKVLNGAISKAW